MSELCVIIPSRGRPGAVADLWEWWQKTSTADSELLICLDYGDDTIDDYPAGSDRLTYAIGFRNGFAPRLSAVAAREASKHFALASWGDDHRPRTVGWDQSLLDAMHELGTGFAYGDDGVHGEHLPSACAMTSDIIATLGWMTPPGLAHMYVDDFWRDMGRALDRIAYLPDVSIEHLHPAVGKGEWDDLVREANTEEKVLADRDVYAHYKAEAMADDLAKLRALL